MVLTDGHKIAAITMQDWDGERYRYDYSCDFFAGAKSTGKIVRYNHSDCVVYYVPDVDYCIDQAIDFMEYSGCFFDPEAREADVARGVERVVSVEDISGAQIF